MIRRSIRLTFGAKAQPGITLQRGDCFSTAICAQCYAPNGCPVSFEGRTVHVVYQTGGQSSPGYEVEARDNVLTWTLPPCAAQTAGPGKMQLMVYGADSLLHSAVIPYTVLDSLEPGEGGEDPVPALVLLLDKAQAAISGANAAASTANQVAQIADTAANLASEKAGLAQNAASSANEAATNATNSAELAQTAADNANSASESANSAAGTANNAADNANSAAESANSAATNANQVADEIQQKADSGAFNGKDGLNAPQIDDTQITTTNPWSSMQIVKTLCPPFTVSGSVVQCYPVANYPLGVKVAWEPHQEGEGEPSPENVRPIVGLDEVQVARCGASLFDFYSLIPETATLNGITADKLPDGRIHVHGTNTNDGFTNVVHVTIPTGQKPTFPAGTYSVGSNFNVGTNLGNKMGSFYAAEQMTVSYFYIAVGSNATVDFYAMPMLVAGDVPSTAYKPYTGTTATLGLPYTVYGGEVDVETGEGWQTVDVISMAVADMDNSDNFPGWRNQNWVGNYVQDTNQDAQFKDVADYIASNVDGGRRLRFNGGKVVYFTSNESGIGLTQSELKTQYPDLVFQFAFKRLAPTSIQATGPQSLPALPGTNTIYADAGDITVTGASDPIATITSLQSRVSALESAQTNM